jgi:MFS family permease
LTAGLKAIVLWFPRERVALINGYMVTFGGLGAVTATTPADWLLDWVGWRGMFELLAAATGATAILVLLVVPEQQRPSQVSSAKLSLGHIFRDRRFLRLAPLSAICVGSAWSMQGLWAVPCFADLEGFDRETILTYLFVMAVVLSGAAWLLGRLAHRLSQQRRGLEGALALIGTLFVAAQLAVILRLPVPLLFSWCIVAAVGAAPVISFAVTNDWFPPEVSGRVNGALSVLHFGWAFIAQYMTGLVLEQWPQVDGHYPGVGYQTAFGICVAFQLTVLFWFAMPWLRAMLGDLVHSRHEFRRKDRQRDTAVQYESVVDTDLSAGVEW